MTEKIRSRVIVFYRKILSMYNNMRIAWKFTWAYFIIIALPIIGTGIFINYTTIRSFKYQAELLARQSLFQKREVINQKIESIEKTAISISQNPLILKYLEDPFENTYKDFDNYINFFAPAYESYIIQNKNIYATTLYIDNPTFPVYFNNIYNLHLFEENDEYRELMEDSQKLQKWSIIHDSNDGIYPKTGRERVFSLLRKLISFSNKRSIGILEIEIAEKELFGNLQTDDDVKEYYLVFDENGNIVSETAYSQFPENLRNKIIPLLHSQQELNGIIKSEKEELIVRSVSLDQIRCNLVGIFPLKNYIGNSPNYTVIIIAVVFAALFIFGVIIYFVSNQLTRRLKILLKGLKSVRYDNINIQLPVTSRDEFGELAENFNHMTNRIHELIERVFKAQILEKEMELKALEAQINPHFLYNTLSTISWMARKVNAENIENLTFLLSKFYRLVLSKGNSIITVRDEIELLKAYIEIEKTRFDNLFRVSYDLDDEALNYEMIKIILQPIAENAINHGIAPKGYKGTLVIKLRQDNENLYFSIIDDGVGIRKDVLQRIDKGDIKKERESGYAIKNVRDRINAVYGEKGSISIFSRPGIGCSVRIAIPKTIILHDSVL